VWRVSGPIEMVVMAGAGAGATAAVVSQPVRERKKNAKAAKVSRRFPEVAMGRTSPAHDNAADCVLA